VSEEAPLWQGSPSHLKDLGLHLVCLALAPLTGGLSLLFGFARYLQTRCTRYEVTSERIRVSSGVFSKTMEETELYRVKDTTVDQPFALRIFALANLVVRASDSSHPRLVLHAIPEASDLREELRGCVEELRREKGVREVDYS